MLSSDDIGHRVVVRRVVGERAGRPLFADVLGELVRLDGAELAVRPDRDPGTPVVIPLPTVVAAKRVPPRRHRIGAEELERIAARTWPAPRTEPLGGWLLRHADGWTGRANTALVAGDPGTDLPTAVDRVVAWYRALGHRPACQLPLPAAADVDAYLAARGWPADPTVHVLTAPLERIDAGEARGGPAVELAGEPASDWLAMAGARKGGLPPAAVSVLTGPEKRIFVERRSGDRLIAIGRGAVVDGWLGITLVEVVPAERRKGLARQILAALVEWAAGQGAHDAFLQVQEANAAARALYRGAGFRLHHTYRYRRSPA
jgi:GNAT superfamily N-acetyltransferase